MATNIINILIQPCKVKIFWCETEQWGLWKLWPIKISDHAGWVGYYWYQSSISFITWLRCLMLLLSKWCNNNWSKWLTVGQFQCLIDSENSQNPLHCNTEDDEHEDPCVGSEAWWNGIWKLVENCELSTSSDFLKFPTDKAARAKREDILSGWMWGGSGHMLRNAGRWPVAWTQLMTSAASPSSVSQLSSAGMWSDCFYTDCVLVLLHSHSTGKILVGKNNSNFWTYQTWKIFIVDLYRSHLLLILG